MDKINSDELGHYLYWYSAIIIGSLRYYIVLAYIYYLSLCYDIIEITQMILYTFTENVLNVSCVCNDAF